MAGSRDCKAEELLLLALVALHGEPRRGVKFSKIEEVAIPFTLAGADEFCERAKLVEVLDRRRRTMWITATGEDALRTGLRRAIEELGERSAKGAPDELVAANKKLAERLQEEHEGALKVIDKARSAREPVRTATDDEDDKPARRQETPRTGKPTPRGNTKPATRRTRTDDED